MRYLLTSNVDPDLMSALDPEEVEAVMDRFIAFTTALASSGVLRSAEQLLPPDTATTVRRRAGDLLLTDGPFADVTETLGGYWVVEAPDLEAVLDHARACPAVDVGSVEVRGLVELG